MDILMTVLIPTAIVPNVIIQYVELAKLMTVPALFLAMIVV
jgi:hypothetical protein